jgi:hypothetical protein
MGRSSIAMNFLAQEQVNTFYPGLMNYLIQLALNTTILMPLQWVLALAHLQECDYRSPLLRV